MERQAAEKLGQLIRAAREKRGLSLRAAGEAAGMNYTWLRDLERGAYTDPAPDRLVKLAEVLGIDPVRIDRISENAVADSLPSVRTYFRSKERLTKAQLDEVESTLERLRAKHAKQTRSHKSKGG